MAAGLCNFLHGLKPTMVMLLVQVIGAGLNLMLKLASKDGMNLQILVAYRCIFATIFLAPFAFFLERNTRPKLTWMVIFQAFLCGLFGGTMSQNLYVACLQLTSVTFATAMGNLIPATTYIMAVIFRLERLRIRTLAGQAKILGTAIGIGGAMVLTFILMGIDRDR
ncbi:WAT1-related protein At1g09380-like [Macadamia integrifolia]|uniref:WAT1-related protein At1g09380-like n=1 Tax=Macadamia integrifolia TaxID=60698 RepID=UPI001C531798|nr:WAT1-related protein At1g09380-like [Macadamia integrifolia]